MAANDWEVVSRTPFTPPPAQPDQSEWSVVSRAPITTAPAPAPSGRQFVPPGQEDPQVQLQRFLADREALKREISSLRQDDPRLAILQQELAYTQQGADYYRQQIGKPSGAPTAPPPTKPTDKTTSGLDISAAPEQFMSGVRGMQQSYFTSAAKNVGTALNVMDRIDRGEQVRDIDDPTGYQYMTPDQRAKTRSQFEATFPTNVAKAIAYGAKQQEYVRNPKADEMIKAANDKDWGKAWKAFSSDPAGVVQQLSVQSAPNALPSLVGGAAGVLLRGGVPAMMAGLATGSFPVEYMSSLVDSLQDAGVDLKDTQAVSAKLRDPKFLEDAGKKAVTRGVVIATADALGGKLAMPLKPKQLGKNIARGGANIATEVGTEMGGEFGAQVASADTIKVGDIIAEGLGAGPQAVASTALRTVEAARAEPQVAPPTAAPRERVEPTFEERPVTPTPEARVEPSIEGAQPTQMQRMFRELEETSGLAPAEAPVVPEAAAPVAEAPSVPPVAETAPPAAPVVEAPVVPPAAPAEAPIPPKAPTAEREFEPAPVRSAGFRAPTPLENRNINSQAVYDLGNGARIHFTYDDFFISAPGSTPGQETGVIRLDDTRKGVFYRPELFPAFIPQEMRQPLIDAQRAVYSEKDLGKKQQIIKDVVSKISQFAPKAPTAEAAPPVAPAEPRGLFAPPQSELPPLAKPEVPAEEEAMLPPVNVPGANKTNKALAEAIENNNWSEVTEQLQRSKNPLIAAVGKMAEDLVGVTTQINPKAFSGLPRNVPAGYDAKGGGIWVRSKTGASSEHAIAHETVHALTIDALRNPTEKQKSAVNRLNNLYEYVKKRLGKDGKQRYGLTNIEEFIAEGNTNVDFQRELARIPYQRQTAWGAFTKTIADLLGIKDSRALTELIALTEELAGVKPEAAVQEAPAKERLPDIVVPAGFKPKKGRIPQLVFAARALAEGKITKDQYDEYVERYNPIKEVLGGDMELPIEDALMTQILTKEIPKKKDPKLVNAPIADGTRVGLRMDIPALDWGRENGVNGSVVSIHEGSDPKKKTQGENISYKSTGRIKNVVFAPRSEEEAFKIAQQKEPEVRTKKTGEKYLKEVADKKPQQTMEGDWVNTSPEETLRLVREHFNDPNWVQVSLDPLRHSFFYARDSKQPVISADEALQVGRFVLVKNPVYGKREDFLYMQEPEAKPAPKAVMPKKTLAPSKIDREHEAWTFGRDELGRPNFGPGAKAYDTVARLANIALDKIAMKPISPELSRAMRNMKTQVAKAQKMVGKLGAELAKLSPQERALVSDVIEGEVEAGVNPPQHVLDVAAAMVELMTRQGQELVRLGMLSKEAYNRWENKYLPRFYQNSLGKEAKAWSDATKRLLMKQPTMQGIKGQQLKSRGKYQDIYTEDLPQWIAEGWEQRDPDFDPKTSEVTRVWRDYTREEREKMGEIRDAMFRFVMGYNASQRDIALGRLYESLAEDYASKSPIEGYVRVPDTSIEGTQTTRYGKLAGMYVPKEIMDHLVWNDQAMNNGLYKLYQAGLSRWKEGKTVLNPVTHANNVFSNFTMAHFAGVSYWDINKYAGALRDFVKNNDRLKEAEDIGLFTGTFSQAEMVATLPPELKKLANMTESQVAKYGDRVWDLMALTLEWGGKKYGARPAMKWAYENEDFFFRYVIYRDARNRGLSPENAREYSNNFIFTYDDLPAGARIMRDALMPFFSYTYKVVPVLTRTALEYPWRYAAPITAAYAANAMAYAIAASLGGEDDDWWGTVFYKYVTDKSFRDKAKEIESSEREKLPSWLKGTTMLGPLGEELGSPVPLGTPKAIRLGMDDVSKMPLFLDISGVLPGGNIVDALNNTGGVDLLNLTMPANPVFTTMMAMYGNKDLFRNKKIYEETDTPTQKAAKQSAWLWKQWAPAIAIGNYHFDNLMQAAANASGKPIILDAGEMGVVNYTGKGKDGLDITPKRALSQMFGVKVKPYDLEVSEQIEDSKKAALEKDLKRQIRKIDSEEGTGYKSPEVAEIERERLRKKLDFIKEGLTVEGKEKK